MTFNTDIAIGFGALLATMVVVQIVAAFIAKKNAGPQRTKKINRVFFTILYPLAIAGFVIALMWTGYRSDVTNDDLPGQVEQPTLGPSEVKTGKNSQEEASKRLDKEAEEGQKESMKDLDEFRNNILDEKEKEGDDQ